MKKLYKKLMKTSALICLLILGTGNVWGATTVWDGSKPSQWNGKIDDNYWNSPAPTEFFTLGADFQIKADAEKKQALEYQGGYYALVVKYLHRAYMKCTQDRTVCFTMQGPNNTPHNVEFVNGSTGEVIEKKVSHAKSTKKGVGSAFTVDFKADVIYEFRALDTEINIKKIEYLVPGVDIIDMDEATDNSTNINTLKNLGSAVREVRINRTLKANQWNTFCSPVALSSSTSPSLNELLNCSQVYVMGSYDAKENTLSFTASNTLPANTPALVKPGANVTNIVVEAKDVSKPASASTLEASSNGLKFVGIYGATNIYTDDHSKFYLNNEGYLVYPTSNEGNNGKIKGFRAYFELASGGSVKDMTFVFDDSETTGIKTIEHDIFGENGRVYSIDGRYMGDSTDNLSRGIYIQNGRKFVVK